MSSRFAWSQAILSNIDAPGTSSTPPTMTRPGSPAAWRSIARMRPLSRGGIDVASIARLSASLGIRELAGDVASSISVGDVTAPVVELLASGEAELELRPAARRQVEPERDDREALRFRLAEELVDLGAPQQQLARPLRLMVVTIRLLERGDVGADQPGLVALDAGIRIGQIHLAGADRLDLRPRQDDPGLKRVLDAEFMPRPPIERNRLLRHVAILPYLEPAICDRRAWRSSRRRPGGRERAHLKVRKRGPDRATHATGVRRDSQRCRNAGPKGRRLKAIPPTGVPD